MRLRFAPSPTGYVHVGNARTALFNYLHAKKHGGKLILRIEDTDIERSKKEYEEILINDFKWLGIEWDEGPDTGGGFGPYRQSERLDLYREIAHKLLDEGKAYYCFCTPEELEQERKEALSKGLPPKYSGKCRNIPPEVAKKRVESGEKAVIRFKMPQDKDFSYNDVIRGKISFDLSLFGDFVILRSNGLPAYNFAVVVDDHYMKVDLVIRGEDHISNTPKQIKIYEALGWTPPEFGHLSMVLGPDGSPLSKRHGATSLNQFKSMGYLPEALLNYLAMLGWAPPEDNEILSKEELIKFFDVRKVSKSGAIFDYSKLNWVNRKHIAALNSIEIIKRAEEFLVKEGYINSLKELDEMSLKWLSDAIDGIKTNIVTLVDVPEELKIFFEYSHSKEAFEELKEEGGEEVLNFVKEFFKGKGHIDIKDIYSLIGEAKKKGLKGKALFHPMRIIFTGKSSGIELDKFLEIMTKTEGLKFKKTPLSLKERLEEAEKLLVK